MPVRPTDDRPPLIRLADDLQALLRRWEAARERRFAARADGRAKDGDAALLAEWEGLEEVGESRQAIAHSFLFMLKVTLEQHPANRDILKELLKDVIEEVLTDNVVNGALGAAIKEYKKR